MKNILTLSLLLVLAATSHGQGVAMARRDAANVAPFASAWRSATGLVIGSNVQAYHANLTSWASLSPSAKENALGNPGTNGYVLSSTVGGTRSWVAQTGGAFDAGAQASLGWNATSPDPFTWTFHTSGVSNPTLSFSDGVIAVGGGSLAAPAITLNGANLATTLGLMAPAASPTFTGTFTVPDATIASSKISDATSAATPNMIVKRDSQGAASFASSAGVAMTAIASSSAVGAELRGTTNHGAIIHSTAGPYHALFGTNAPALLGIERERGFLKWFYSSFDGRLKTADFTANREWTLPDATGTLALTNNAVFTGTFTVPDATIASAKISDATSTGFVDKVLKTGTDGQIALANTVSDIPTLQAESTVAGGTAGLFVTTVGTAGMFEASTGLAMEAIGIGPYLAGFSDGNLNTRFKIKSNGGLEWTYNPFLGVLQRPPTLTANRDWTLPDATGTLALDTTVVPGTDDTYTGHTITGLTNTGGVTQWCAVYLNSSGAWVAADANGAGAFPARGIAATTATTGNAVSVVTGGVFRDDGGTAWTPGGNIYLSAAGGGVLTQTAPSGPGDAVQVIGFALTATSIYLNISSDYATAP